MQVGQQLFVYYVLQNVTFGTDDVPIMRIGDLTVPITIVGD
jgi:hypothetical protein